MSPTFVKIGERIINPNQITTANLNYSEDTSKGTGVEIYLADSTLTFWEEEAEILRAFFLARSRTYDLNSFYGKRSKVAQ